MKPQAPVMSPLFYYLTDNSMIRLPSTLHQGHKKLISTQQERRSTRSALACSIVPGEDKIQLYSHNEVDFLQIRVSHRAASYVWKPSTMPLLTERVTSGPEVAATPLARQASAGARYSPDSSGMAGLPRYITPLFTGSCRVTSRVVSINV